jgi:hypothetical protein
MLLVFPRRSVSERERAFNKAAAQMCNKSCASSADNPLPVVLELPVAFEAQIDD